MHPDTNEGWLSNMVDALYDNAESLGAAALGGAAYLGRRLPFKLAKRVFRPDPKVTERQAAWEGLAGTRGHAETMNQRHGWNKYKSRVEEIGDYDDGVQYRGVITNPKSGEQMGEFTRTVYNNETGQPEIWFDGLVMDRAVRGKRGIGTDFVREELKRLREMGIKRVNVAPGMSAGGYAWPKKMGAVPTENDWLFLQYEIMEDLDVMLTNGQISKQTYNELAKLAMSENPKAIWKIADHKLGKDLLAGKEYQAYYDLTDPEVLRRAGIIMTHGQRAGEAGLTAGIAGASGLVEAYFND